MAGGAGFITAADATIVFTATPILPPTVIAGFAPDDVFQVPQRVLAQTEMGVDGFLASGYVFNFQTWNFTLQAPSPSNDFFDDLVAEQDAGQRTFFIQGTVDLPSTGKSYLLQNGTLVDYAPAPAARQVLQPRPYGIRWQKVIIIPAIPAAA